MKNKIEYIVGVDEVGRGPLAGPVAVCAFKTYKFFKKTFLLNQGNFIFDKNNEIKDSKKLTAKKRKEIFDKLVFLKKEKLIDFFVCYESARKIDKIGLSKAIKNCLNKAIDKLKLEPEKCLILLDGGLKASEKFINQKTIIKGDEKEKNIAFASIIAKVSRDVLMCKIAKKYPKYSFEINKGYGTKKHCEAIKKNGLCFEHRKSFCKKIIF
ncbi:MAG: ribonuclease HII [bacterium]